MLPGSAQMGHAKRLLDEFPWWEMETHNEWVDPSWDGEDVQRPTAAGAPGKFRLVYLPRVWDPPLIKGIESGVTYYAFYQDPTNGKRVPIGAVEPDADGSWRSPIPPEMHDWVLAMKA